MADSEDIDEGIKYLFENATDNEYEKVFDLVYLFSGTLLAEIQMQAGLVKFYLVEKEVINKISKEAKKK